MPTAEITVGILTTGERNGPLQELFTSISRAIQRYDGMITVVIATAYPSRIPNSIVETYSKMVRVVETDGTAPNGRARIIEVASTDWMLFLDDDCTVTDTIFVEYATSIESNQPEEVGAVYGPVVFTGTRSPAFDAYFHTPYIYPFGITEHRNSVEWAPTANALLSVSAVQDVGNFDNSNPIAVSGEDVDVGLQLKRAGYRRLTNENAVVYHTTSTWNTLRGNLRRCYRYGQSEAWLHAKYPTRRRPLFDACSFTRGALIAATIITITILVPPVVLTGWLVRRILAWSRTSENFRFITYIISDMYRLTNFLGYVVETLRRPFGVRGLVSRFEFYRHQPRQSAIRASSRHASNGTEHRT